MTGPSEQSGGLDRGLGMPHQHPCSLARTVLDPAAWSLRRPPLTGPTGCPEALPHSLHEGRLLHLCSEHMGAFTHPVSRVTALFASTVLRNSDFPAASQLSPPAHAGWWGEERGGAVPVRKAQTAPSAFCPFHVAYSWGLCHFSPAPVPAVERNGSMSQRL